MQGAWLRWPRGFPEDPGRTAVVLAVLVGGALALALILKPVDPVALLVIEENSIRTGKAPATAGSARFQARVSVDTGPEGALAGPIVAVAPDLLPVGPRTRVLVYHSTTSGFDIMGDSLWQVRASPFRIPSNGTGTGAAAEQPGSNQALLLRLPDVTLQSIGRGGDLALAVDTANVTLGPGEQWAGAWVLEADGPRVVSDDRWDREVRDAVAEGTPLTVLRITNVGWVRRKRLTAMPSPAASGGSDRTTDGPGGVQEGTASAGSTASGRKGGDRWPGPGPLASFLLSLWQA